MGEVINANFGQSTFRSGPEVPPSASATAKTQPVAAGTGAMPPDPITAGLNQLAQYWQTAQLAMNNIGSATALVEPGLFSRLHSDFEQIRQAAGQLQDRITRDAADATINAWQRDIEIFAQNVMNFTAAVDEQIAQLPVGAQKNIAARAAGGPNMWLLGAAAISAGLLIVGGLYWAGKAAKKNKRAALAAR